MRLLAKTKTVVFKLLYNKCYYWINHRYNYMTKCSSLSKYKHDCRYIDSQCRIISIRTTTFNITKNFHKCPQTNCENADLEDVLIPSNSPSLEIEEHSDNFRNSLYPMSNDPIIINLKSCDSVTSLLTVIKDNSLSLKSMHYCQFILVLWNLCKDCVVHNTMRDKTINKPFPENATYLDNSYKNDVYFVLMKALDNLTSDLGSLSTSELVYSVMYLNRLGIHLKNPLIQNMLMKIRDLLIKEDTDAFPLHLISRLSIIFVENDELWTRMFLIKLLPYIYKHFDHCSNVEDFKALTISMLSTVPYLREELLLEFEALTDDLQRCGILTKDHTSAIVKAIMLLNYIYHKPPARNMVYRLLQMLNGQINNIFTPHLRDLLKVVFTNLEPQFTIAELESAKQTLSSELPNFLQSHHSILVSIPSNQDGANIMKDLITRTNHLEGLLCLYHLLTTAHLEACHMFWTKAASLAVSVNSFLLQALCLRYIMFTHRMGYYRNRLFESHMLSLITTELVTGSTFYRPADFSMLAAFVLCYEHRQHNSSSLSSSILPRLVAMAGQFSPYSCFVLSKGLNQAISSQRNKEMLNMYLQLDSAINSKTREILESQNHLSISTFNILLRTCINRRETSDRDLLSDIMKRCEELDWSELTSRSLRNLVYNFISTDSLVPAALDRMAEYCLNNRLCVTSDTVGKLAYLCYLLGHSPASGHSFWALTADLATRNHKYLNGLSLLQTALALSFFNHLPASLNRLIFCVDFLERLDDEIKNCFAKARYPLRVRRTLMQLNRSVCLDNPEADVPWFHSKFCQEQQSLGMLDARPKTLLFTDIFSSLCELVGDPSYIGQNILTPYGYTLDFQINLDAALNPVSFKDSENAAHKLAMLLYYGDCYTSYQRSLKGQYQMKQRHLEILGYKVIGLSGTLWNTMWMAEPVAKHEYLHKLIWPS